jgi:hypothetical protein
MDIPEGARDGSTAITITFARKYDVELGGKFQWWAGFLALA